MSTGTGGTMWKDRPGIGAFLQVAAGNRAGLSPGNMLDRHALGVAGDNERIRKYAAESG